MHDSTMLEHTHDPGSPEILTTNSNTVQARKQDTPAPNAADRKTKSLCERANSKQLSGT